MKIGTKLLIGAGVAVGVGALACYGLKKLLEDVDIHCHCGEMDEECCGCCECEEKCDCGCECECHEETAESPAEPAPAEEATEEVAEEPAEEKPAEESVEATE